MKIIEVVNSVKSYTRGISKGVKIDDNTTRDKILYGDANQECTGIVTTIYASIDVIKKAHELKANMIICHETLFWNHGDHQEWLIESQNKTYLEKKKLLDEYHICVWRCHDYIHSGIPVADEYYDGIWYGFAKETGWDDAIVRKDKGDAVYLEIKERSARDIARELIKKWHLTGLKCIGNLDCKVKKMLVCGHVMEGGNSNDLIKKIDEEDINLLLPLELIDFTLTVYVKDSAELGLNRVIFAPGHFNIEEPGMKYVEKWIDDALKEHIDCHFVQAGDMYNFEIM